jgi:hypothetical protein
MSNEQLLSIYREAEAELNARLSVPPQACPNDGTRLESGPRGVLFCPFDGVQWPRDRALFKEANHP